MTGRAFVVGLDIGGSSTRAVAADRAGSLGEVGRAGGANPSTTPPAEFRKAVGSAVDEATAGLDRSDLVSVAVGLAGLDEQRRSEIEAMARDAIGAPSESRLVLRSDAEVAFAAGTDRPDGVVLIAGTGAIGSRITNHRETRTVDGHGWRLGDSGSGYWLGAAVVRRVLDALDGRAAPTALTDAVVTRLSVEATTALNGADGDLTVASDDPRRWAILRATARMRTSELAAFASLALTVEDEAANALVRSAADELERTVLALQPASGDPIVLAGGLLTSGRLAEQLLGRLHDHGLAAALLTREPVFGAVALARRAVGWT